MMNDCTKNSGVKVNPALRARSDRLAQLRKMAKISKKELAKRCDVAQPTVSHWENLTGNSAKFGLPARSAPKVIQAIKQEGITASVNWLLHGEGEPPSFSQRVSIVPNRFHNQYKENQIVTSINAMIESLRQDDTNFIMHKIADDTMSPTYHKNDYIVAISVAPENWAEFEGKAVLVLTDNSKYYLRMLRGSHTHQYVLIGSNLTSPYDNFLVQPESIQKIFQIVAHIKWGESTN